MREFSNYLPIKSTIRRPSQALPEGCPKKVMPLGDSITLNAADIPPVSEFESPKLYTAGNRQLPKPPAPINNIGHPTKPRKRINNTRRSFNRSMILQQSKAKAVRGWFFGAQIFSGFVPILEKWEQIERKWAKSGIWTKYGSNLSVVVGKHCRWRHTGCGFIMILYEKCLEFCDDVNLLCTCYWQELFIIDHGG